MPTGQLVQIPRLYHFTDKRNLDSIRKVGGLHPLADLIAAGVKIPAPGGNQWSHDADAYSGVDRFVHLCFRSDHPMEYAARKDGRIVESIFLQIDPAVLDFPGVMFAPDVSNRAGVEPVNLSQAPQMIDFQVLYTKTDWKDPAIQARLQAASKCEILVPACIPLRLIRNI